MTVYVMTAIPERFMYLSRYWARRLRAAQRCAVLGFTLGLAALPTQAQRPPAMPASLPKQQLNVGIHLIQAEVARDDATRARGLMFRRQLGVSDGMLFVFARAGIQCFWMRNTFIPLSIAFLNDDGTIVNLADMQPLDDTSHCSAQPVRYALEMNQGWFAQRGIGPQAVIEGLPKPSAPGR